MLSYQGKQSTPSANDKCLFDTSNILPNLGMVTSLRVIANGSDFNCSSLNQRVDNGTIVSSQYYSVGSFLDSSKYSCFDNHTSKTSDPTSGSSTDSPDPSSTPSVPLGSPLVDDEQPAHHTNRGGKIGGIVAGFFLLAAVVFFVVKKSIKKRQQNSRDEDLPEWPSLDPELPPPDYETAMKDRTHESTQARISAERRTQN
jgi:hypothetical protein